jgi:exodeoxyribonuclease VII small subunit
MAGLFPESKLSISKPILRAQTWTIHLQRSKVFYMSESKDKPVEAEALSFEDSLEALERIIGQIENGDIGLEASLEAYKQGESLIKRCRGLLFDAEQRIESMRLEDLPADGESSENN